MKQATADQAARKTAHKTANAILEEEGSGMRDLNLPPPPLFDVVYRIPEASLKLARDDRQAGLHYMQQRKKMFSGEPLQETTHKR